MMIEAAILALTGIRHAFFTRAGGVSGGLYASLNGGTGSHDDAANVAENRARMAARSASSRSAFSRLPDPFAEVVVAETPWTAGRAAARRRHRHAHAGAGDRRDHRGLRPDSLRRSAGARDRRRACRLARSARAASSRRRSPRWSSSAPRAAGSAPRSGR